MRTHRLKVTCNSKECAKWLKEEILEVDFCDFTHWYCGLDDAGEDTPDDCVIYLGTLHPNVVYVELNLQAASLDPETFKTYVHLGHYGSEERDWNVEEIEVEELDHWTELQKAKAELKSIKDSIKKTILSRD